MPAAPAQRRYTVEEYASVEAGSPIRHEYLHGVIYAMAGGTPRHNEIGANLVAELRRALAGSPCRPLGPDQRLQVSREAYTYADASVFCGRVDTAMGTPADAATNPRLVAEIHSPSTRDYDRGEKLAMYQSVPSVEVILLLEQDAARVTVWRRRDDTWTAETATDGAIDVLGTRVSIRAVYERAIT
jgi:Uma2 family endonuclease